MANLFCPLHIPCLNTADTSCVKDKLDTAHPSTAWFHVGLLYLTSPVRDKRLFGLLLGLALAWANVNQGWVWICSSHVQDSLHGSDILTMPDVFLNTHS